jgi:transposase
MISFGTGQRYFLYREPADMRKSFDGLCGLVRSGLGRDPLKGDVFVFVNRLRTHVKLLAWDRNGFVLYYKRLEEGTLELPEKRPDGTIEWRELVCMLEGVSLQSVQYRKRYVLTDSGHRGDN